MLHGALLQARSVGERVTWRGLPPADAGRAHRDPDRLCDAPIGRIVGHRPGGDVAIVAVRCRAQDGTPAPAC